MFADQLDVTFLDDSSALHRAIGVPTTGAKSVDFSFLDNELFGSGCELEEACSVFTGSEDYSRMLLEWQQHMGLIGSNLVDFDDPLSGSCFKDSQFVPSFSDNVGVSNSKDIAALEADDLDSLLARFEASQAADWLLNDYISPVEPVVLKPVVNCIDSEEYPESNVIEEVIVGADDEAEYIDVEEVEEEVQCKPEDDALVEQHNVDLDHDYCLVVTTNESDVDVDIVEDNSVSGLYNKIPSYYHETVLLRGNSCASLGLQETVTEEIVLEENPASPQVVGDASDSGLYCRLPPYITECLPPTVKTKCDLGDIVGKQIATKSGAPTEILPSTDTGILPSSTFQADDSNDSLYDHAILNIKEEEDLDNNQITDRVPAASPIRDKPAANPSSDSPKSYDDSDERCRYYERKSRQRHRHHRERKTRYNRYSSSRSPTRSCSSRSRSSSSSSSKSSSRSRTWSRSRSRSRSPLSRSYSSSSSSHREDSEARFREWRRKKMRPIEERRIIYVGNISSGTTRNDLRRRFSVFGPIEEVTVHFRDHGDDYGFVTFLYKVDAFEALAHGNDDRSQPQYDLCFGGRRHFCQSSYADLDGLNAVEQNSFSSPQPQASAKRVESDFDAMLRAAQASRQSKLQKGHS